MGQMKTKCSSSATGLFFLLLMIVSFSSCTRTQKDIIPSAEYAPYVNAYTEELFHRTLPYVLN